MKVLMADKSLNLFSIIFGLILSVPVIAGAIGEDTALVEQQLGQMVLAGFKGTSPEDPRVQAVAGLISAGKLGGVILFRHNIESPQQLKTLTAFLRQATLEPLLIAVDQEGGRVQRLTAAKGFTDYPSHEKVAQADVGIDHVYDIYKQMALELKSNGINLNLAPVVDLSINPKSRIIAQYERSFSSDSDLTTAYATAFIRAHRDVGVLTTIKHWPGHGSAAEDSHLGVVDVTDTWSTSEANPYMNLIKNDLVDGVMTAHVFHRKMDKDYPATLSKAIIQERLRDQMLFDGVVFTDCLQMGAITSLFGGKTEEAALHAIGAGADIMVVSNYELDDSAFVDRLLNRVLERMREDGGYMKSRLEESNKRILQLKKRLLASKGHDEL